MPPPHPHHTPYRPHAGGRRAWRGPAFRWSYPTYPTYYPQAYPAYQAWPVTSPAAYAVADTSCPAGYARSLSPPFSCEPLGQPVSAPGSITGVIIAGAALAVGILLGTRMAA